jgi:hypothetical protein
LLDRAKTRLPILLSLEPAKLQAAPDENPPRGWTERAPPARRFELPGPQAETPQLRTHGERVEVVLRLCAKAMASQISQRALSANAFLRGSALRTARHIE